MNRKDLINFYKGTNYELVSLSVRGMPPRPSEWNLPQFIKTIYEDNLELFKKSLTNNAITIKLDNEDLNYFRALLLHESLFNFYKAFYNYLCAIKMYDGGLEHWIEITAYYSKFYLASSIITLSGKSRYIIKGNNHNFVEEIYKIVNPNGYNKNISKNGVFQKKHAKYGIELDIDPSKNESTLYVIKDLGSGGSHTYIWGKYEEINSNEFGITKMTHDYPQHLSDERNVENYSFEGYRQLDFNLDPNAFRQYFNRDYIKRQSEMIYTSETAIVLGVIGELYNLFKSLGVDCIPIEKEKLFYMCKYSLGKNEKTRKLIDLIDSSFPENNKYLTEYLMYETN
ncbi:hypothetical protein KK120_11625 [Virgibacillus dakarensis]|nr:hypothetical protein [Virgibacillus dakarensis]